MSDSRNSLGRCEQCKGKLLTKGDKICCGQCGLPVPNHPLAARLFHRPAAAAIEPGPEVAVGTSTVAVDSSEETRHRSRRK